MTDTFYCVCKQRNPDSNPGTKPCPDTDKCHLCGAREDVNLKYSAREYYFVSTDDGKTWEKQHLYESDVLDEIRRGHMVQKATADAVDQSMRPERFPSGHK